jgi:putative nucleotidyltransferase with HDIG domain
VKWRIRLRGINGVVEGQAWEAEDLLRVGRTEAAEIAIDDGSVSRRHAELFAGEDGWHLRDLGSTNGTSLNGTRLGPRERPLRPRDVIQFGKLTVVVERIEELSDSAAAADLQVEAATRAPWDEALRGLAFDYQRCPRPGEQLMALLRASHHLGHLESEEELLHTVLQDAVSALDAQRGAIVLADGPGGRLRLRALASGRNDPGGRAQFSQSLANRCFSRGESVLCGSVGDDPSLATAQSIHEGAMGSVICALLRTPRKRLGVIHLDRGHLQDPFTRNDLHLADALAASVSAGIESAQLLHKQRQLFLNTLTVLSQAVEMRDPYTGGHTSRVTQYSLLLARRLGLAAEELEVLRYGTPLHDIGKIGIDDAILRKPGRLTPEEFEVMKAHTTKGAAILATIPEMEPAVPIARSHHERWSGQGYPQGLAGESIPRLARVVAVADAFDAMSSDRPYRKGVSPEAALVELEKQGGRQFDPECVAAFVAVRDEIERELRSNRPGLSAVENPAEATITL